MPNTKFFLPVTTLPSWSRRSSPSRIWQIIGFAVGGASVLDPGCMMTSRIDTVLKPGIVEGFSPYLTHSGHGLVSVLVCEAAGFTMMVEAAANPIANAERRSTLSIDSSRDVPRTALTGYRITRSTAYDRSETYWRAGTSRYFQSVMVQVASAPVHDERGDL